ncbi:MAG: UvrD-helicase domain-containing protein [Candidatus Sungbacteria bacterium]|nr:UvrD-helicase domain-containing protein [Candidatus Sungbacteria bacterium]
MDLLKGLNEKQQEAVLAAHGPVLILAGPGSGKTKTITHRIAHLISTGILGENILAVTFTNKAATEMRERVGALLKDISMPYGGQLPFIGTFHSFCVRILQVHAQKLGYLPRFTIFDDSDTSGLIKEIMADFEINPKQFTPGAVSAEISRLKNELITPAHYAETNDLSNLFPKTIQKIYAEYQHRLRQSNAMDFDDLLGNAVLLFENHPEVLASYQDRFQYIHVDEWQDTNHVQYLLIKALAEKTRNIAVVGDDAQAIYAFRGADFRNILNFEQDWPDAKVIILDQNYRSTQVILTAASAVISRNKNQREKQLWTQQQGGSQIMLSVTENERTEAGYLLDTVKEQAANGYSLKDMVVLYRTNAQSRIFEEMLLENNIPYKIVGGVRFYQRKEIKDILAYIRLLLNEKDALSLKRIINVPPRGIGKKSLELYRQRTIAPAAVHLRKDKTTALDAFDTLLAQLRDALYRETASGFIKHLVSTVKYREYLEETQPQAEERWQNIEELVSVAKQYDDLDPPAGLEKLLEDAALMSEQNEENAPQDALNLMTLHAAKGLEFRIVFLVGMEEGIFPHNRALFSPSELEEERRLCYVGLTRAKEKVFLSCALRRMHFGSIQANIPSRFLREIPEHLIEIGEQHDDEIFIQ